MEENIIWRNGSDKNITKNSVFLLKMFGYAKGLTEATAETLTRIPSYWLRTSKAVEKVVCAIE